MSKANRKDIRAILDGQSADSAGVKRFAQAMDTKLAKKRADGRGGWNIPEQCSIEYLTALLAEHWGKQNLVDIANFCMMVWNRKNPKGQ